LNISFNHLESLPSEAFAGNKELRELHLQGNDLYDLPKGLLHRLEQLLVLDLSGNQLTSHHVDNSTFAGLIRLIVLNLSNNALTRIGAKTFKELYFLQILDMRNNSIGHIEEGPSCHCTTCTPSISPRTACTLWTTASSMDCMC